MSFSCFLPHLDQKQQQKTQPEKKQQIPILYSLTLK